MISSFEDKSSVCLRTNKPGIAGHYGVGVRTIENWLAWGIIQGRFSNWFSRKEANDASPLLNPILASTGALASVVGQALSPANAALPASLRLPSLLAGLLYLWVVFRMARRWFGDGPAFLAVVGLLTLNPIVVDALSEARGYGMALASWMLALELILESVQSFSLQQLNLAAICLGLSVAAALPFAAPAVALLDVFLLWSKTTGGAGASACQFVNLALIFFLTAFVLLAIPLNHAQWKTLGVGATSLRQTINEITALSLGTSLKVIAAIARVALALVAVAGVFASV